MTTKLIIHIILAITTITIAQFAKTWTKENYPPSNFATNVVKAFSIIQFVAAICLGALLTTLALTL